MGATNDIFLVRHGHPLCSWVEGRDVGLSETGWEQASRVVNTFANGKPLDIVSSPLVRARETASALAEHWQRTLEIDDRYCEVPLSNDTESRRAWLVDALHGRWDDIDQEIALWRDRAWQAFLELKRDTVIFTHFMLINALLSRALADDRLVVFEPDYGSVTHLRRMPDGSCAIIKRGRSL